jgi:hypothetical protein
MINAIKTIIVLIIFYGLGAFSCAMIANTLWPTLIPWAGLLFATIYVMIITILVSRM